MKQSVYVESSVVSYLASRASRDVIVAGHQASTYEWWTSARHEYELFISSLVLEEISAGDADAAAARLRAVAEIPSLAIRPEAERLATKLVSSKAVPEGSARDALHIAIAAAQRIDYLLTWNFKHINNASTRALIASVVREFGFPCPVLCSPEELTSES